MKQCSKCKQTFEDEVVFCPHCGEKLEVVPAECKCVRCGKVIDEGCDFCPYCGASQIVEVKPKKKEKTVSEETKTPLSSEDLKKYKVRRWIGMAFSAFLIIWPIINHGFSFGWIWYVLLLVVLLLMFAFYSMKEETKEELDAIDGFLIILFIILVIMYLWGPINSDYSY